MQAADLEEAVATAVAARDELRETDKKETRVLIQPHPDVLDFAAGSAPAPDQAGAGANADSAVAVFAGGGAEEDLHSDLDEPDERGGELFAKGAGGAAADRAYSAAG